jgi:glutathione peroxidase
MTNSIHDFVVKSAAGQDQDLSAYKGQVVLVINVASKCGFTPQYKGLEELNQKFAERGLVILGFPCNQFGAQEPGNDQEIQSFCKLTYDVSFPIMSKIDVNGEHTAPLFQFLKSSAPGLLGTEMVKWNFTKFLVGKDGKVIKRYAPNTEPAALEADIINALKV